MYGAQLLAVLSINRDRCVEGRTNLTVPSQLRLLFRSNDLSILLEQVWIAFTVDDPTKTDGYLCSMRLINVKAFLERESLIGEGKAMDRRVKVLDFGDDEETEYAILSHRWIGQEVDHDEIVDLAKMAVEERDEIRQRGGYRKILDTCGQAQKDGYEWLWVDTCCIDKRSSAELSEAINSMYRWYENAKVCYAYLHDVPGSSFPTASDDERYRGFSGWPEWFSRGWTLQELIAPSNIQFFNKNWQNIGDKRTLASTLQDITRIPEHILMHGLHGNRPCVAQIMSWTADRKTTRVEDRAYSLMGLLDVNMPMLYGEGKKAFHRLQLEIIRASNDQSIFAWYGPGDEPGSVLADDPSCFWSCDRMELMGHDEFVRYFKEDVSDEELDFVQDRLGTFPITNRGIQIWMLLHPEAGSPTFFKARLPCRGGPWDRPVTITLTLWESNYYRYRGPSLPFPTQFGPPQFRQVYLGYQSLPHPNTTFEIDDSALTENGFTYRAAYPMKFSGDTLTLTSTDPLCAKVYSDSVTDHCLVVSLGKSSGQDWIYVVSDESNTIPRLPWQNYIAEKYYETRFGAPGHTRQRMDLARPGAERYGQIFIMQTRLPQSTRILRISSVSWKSSRMCAVKLEVFHDPSFSEVSGKWAAFDVDVGTSY